MKQELMNKKKILNPLLFFLLIVIITPSSSHGTNYVTVNPGPWNASTTWQDNIIPSYSGGLGNGDVLYIDHDVTLIGESFLSGSQAKKFEVHIGRFEPVVFQVENDFMISNTIDVIVYEGSSFIVGKVPSIADYDFCGELATENALFQVEGSEQDPSLRIRNQAKFILYGNLEVKNRFNIEVAPGGLFKVYGNFTAGNTATVSLTGAGAQVGCDMIFDNSAEIHMDVGTLTVGGDLFFGNKSKLTLIGSTINVGGTICSYPGGGAGATVYLVGTEENPSYITSLHTCEDITLEEIKGGITLPIKLLSFSHQLAPGQVILQWETASEINNDYFTIERSPDMQQWEVIGHVIGAGNSNQQLTYRLADHMPLKGLSYYRLKQTDFDGQYEYFETLAVNYMVEENTLGFRVTKSPGQWVVSLPAAEYWQVEVHALNGRILFSGKAKNTFSFSAPGQPVVIRVYNDVTLPLSRVIM